MASDQVAHTHTHIRIHIHIHIHKLSLSLFLSSVLHTAMSDDLFQWRATAICHARQRFRCGRVIVVNGLDGCKPTDRASRPESTHTDICPSTICNKLTAQTPPPPHPLPSIRFVHVCGRQYEINERKRTLFTHTHTYDTQH